MHEPITSVATEKLTCYVCRLVLAVCTTAVLAASSPDATPSPGFILYNTLEDGELETRIRWKEYTAKEVTVGRGLGITFRQLTDGKHFIQVIYDEDDKISDCEYLHQKQSVNDFIDTFRKDTNLLTTLYNATLVQLNHKLPDQFKRWLNYKTLKDQCKKKHHELKKMLKMRARSENFGSQFHKQHRKHQQTQRKYHTSEKHYNSSQIPENYNHNHSHNHIHNHSHRHQNRIKRDTTFGYDKSDNYLLFPGTLWCGKSDAADRYTALGMMSGTDKCCRKHDYCKMNIPGFSYRYGMFNKRPFTLSECRCDMSSISGPGRRDVNTTSTATTASRHRRDLGDYLRIPGTKWCGKGRSAYKYTDIGMFSTTDKCCRKHDSACPFWISGFDTKYGLFNWRVNTIMHCHCDERFRACLKRLDSSDANLVGKLFFNVVQTKCFVFKPKKTCVQRSWWGKCQKKKLRKQAVLRDNMPY